MQYLSASRHETCTTLFRKAHLSRGSILALCTGYLGHGDPGSLFRNVQSIAAKGVQGHGADMPYAQGPDETQEFYFTLGDHVGFSVKS